MMIRLQNALAGLLLAALAIHSTNGFSVPFHFSVRALRYSTTVNMSQHVEEDQACASGRREFLAQAFGVTALASVFSVNKASAMDPSCKFGFDGVH